MSHLGESELFVELAAREYLAPHGVPLVPSVLVRDRAGLDDAIRAFGPVLVLKVAAPWLVHKSDLGLVRVDVRQEVAAAAFDELVEAGGRHGQIDGILVAPRLEGVEMIVGMRRDPTLGPFVVVGAGGVLVEVLGDHAIAPIPVDAAGAMDLIRSLRAVSMLDGRRGARVLDMDALSHVVAAVSALAEGDPRLAEVDLNPVIVGERGAVAVDARVVRNRETTAPATARRERDLHPMVDPRSIAVVGASTDANKLGARIVRYLVRHGFTGRVVPIHPTALEIGGRSAVPSVADTAQIDLACIVVPPAHVESALEDCAGAGIKNAIIHTAGFAEAGPDGADAQRRIVEVARSTGINVCGPNSLGIISPGQAVFSSFAGALESASVQSGRIGFVSQSGAIASSLLSRSVEDGVGFSRWISSGNEADLDLADYVSFLASDPETALIALFVEQIRDGQAFRAAVGEALRAGKPVLAYKAGRSAIGRRATQSHTGALAGDDELYESFLRAAGVVRVSSLRDLLDAARVIVSVPPARGRRLGVLTMSGGASSVIADIATAHGLALPQPDARTARALASLLPAAATVANPLDVTAAAMVDARILTSAVARLAEGDFVDIVLVQLTTNADPVAAEMATALVQICRSAGKPVVISRLGSAALAPRAMEIYRAASVPVLTWPEDATRVAWAVAAAAEAVANVSSQQEVATTH